tara:strand:+ start:98 stop:472 length:375 start_codon:yes stop_codon:yes gene_type:complete
LDRRKQSHNYKDVQIAFLLDGLKGVQKLHEREQLSREVVQKAVKILKSLGKDTESLAQWAKLQFRVKRLGRPAPKVGEHKLYKAQQIKDGGLFLRLPVETLVDAKGMALEVRFEADRIEVRKKS